VRLPVQLRRYGASEIVVEGADVRTALDDLFRRFPELRERVVDESGELRSHLLVFRNGVELPRAGCGNAPVDAADLLELVAAVDGG
jgi:hypothetical protein